jgi:hypothetical protein
MTTLAISVCFDELRRKKIKVRRGFGEAQHPYSTSLNGGIHPMHPYRIRIKTNQIHIPVRI